MTFDSVTHHLKLAFSYLAHPLFEIGGNKISIWSIIVSLLLLVVTFKLARWIESKVKMILKDRKGVDEGVKVTLERVSRYIVLTIGILICLDTVGVSLSSLAAVGAVLMVGIGFGLQNITQNFISGLILLFERPIKRGDIICVGNIEGKVESINARSTLVITRDDVAILVPNSQFIAEQVTNNSYSSKIMRLSIRVGVSYSSDAEKVREVLLDVASKHSHVLQTPLPAVLFKNFGDSSLDFDLSIWIDDIWNQAVIMSDLRFAIKKSFDDNRIEIPFPQRDLHLRSGSFIQQ
jgi:small-conductance mechanosensitive channel